LILDNLSYDEILDEEVICRILGYENPNASGEIRGWRILSKTSLSEAEAAKVIKELGNLEGIMVKKFDNLTHVIGDKVRILAEELEKMRMSD